MTMGNKDTLPDDLLFEADGHVTDVALACLADGEIALLPAAAAAHVDGCDACTARLGAEALRSLVAREALREVETAASESRALALTDTALLQPASSRRPRRPLPLLAIAAALVLGAAGSAPWFFESAAALSRQLPSVQLLVRVLVVLARSAPEGLPTAALLLRWASAAVLIVVGSAVALSVTRRRSLQEQEGEVG